MTREEQLNSLHQNRRGVSNLYDYFLVVGQSIDGYRFGYPILPLDKVDIFKGDFVFLLSKNHPREHEVKPSSCWKCHVIAHPIWNKFFYLHPVKLMKSPG